MPSGAFNICCPRDRISRHNGGTSGAPLKPLRVNSALRTLSSLRGLRLHQSEFRLVQNLLEKGNHNPNLVWNNKISKTFICMHAMTRHFILIKSGYIWRACLAQQNATNSVRNWYVSITHCDPSKFTHQHSVFDLDIFHPLSKYMIEFVILLGLQLRINSSV